VTARAARAAVLGVLERLRGGQLMLHEPGGIVHRLGIADGADPLRVRAEIRDARAWTGLLRGSVGLAESYAAGHWDTSDLVALVRLAARNMPALDRLRDRWRPLLRPVQRAGALARRNTPLRSRRHIAAHYDLGNELFARFLDPSMTYSAALWDGTPGDTLARAQERKLERICRELRLGPDTHVLEIGTGWGGFALHAAGRHGARVTTTTISAEQHALASERVRAAGLADRVTVLCDDYRDLRGRYDRLVSIEMIEAVGWEYLGTYFERCASLLGRGGAMLLQAICIDDAAYEAEKTGRSFANAIVFPGGCLPSRAVIRHALARTGDLREAGELDLTGGYVRTLRAWRERFHAHAAELDALGYDGPFRRMWDLYLAYSEGGFAERRITDWQLLLAKPGWRAATATAPVIAEASG
jgi:cyclopropane-fatty-acyl-phospholipid synthase